MQSVPVSPPPMTMTRLPLALMYWLRLRAGVDQALGVLLQELHREVDAVEFASGGRAGRAGRAVLQASSIRIVAVAERGGVDIDPDVRVGDELDTLGGHEVDAAPKRFFRRASCSGCRT